MHHDSAYTSLEDAELAKEPLPSQHVELEPLRFDWSPEEYKMMQFLKEMDASLDYEDAELAKEPDPCQHVVMPVRFVDEEPAHKPCPCRSHDCEVDGIDAAYERFTSEWSESIYSKQPKPATAPTSSPVVESAIIPAAFITAVFAGGVLIGLLIAFTVLR